MKITDRRSSAAHSWLDLDEHERWRAFESPTCVQSMTVNATDDNEPTGLLDVQGRSLFRVRRGPGFGIW